MLELIKEFFKYYNVKSNENNQDKLEIVKANIIEKTATINNC